ncbi:MAG: hypothetical protein DMF85_18330 [Acidobacteria bacterium]|nr:MAG: hypothetical protein DMF85_18330 [Acidobacteriota bacterium]
MIKPAIVGCAAVAAVAAMQPPAAPAILFRDITREAGVTFQHHTAPEKKFIVESMSGGVALFDYDNDGLPDLYFVDSLTVDTAADPKAARSALYRNLGKGRFEDVTDKAGVGHPGWGMGVCTADVDGDGWEDIYVTALGGSHLYRNNHDGTFTDVTERAGVGVGGWTAGCGFADYDHDGRLDLFVSRRRASTAASRCSADRAGCRVKATSSFTTTATGISPTSRRRRASRIRAATSGWASRGSTSTTTGGRISTLPTTPRRTSCT